MHIPFDGPDQHEQAEELATPTRHLTYLEITSGLPDDSHEAAEREEDRRLRDLRGRVKHARALVARTTGLAETLARDWQKAARFGITEAMIRQCGPSGSWYQGTYVVTP